MANSFQFVDWVTMESLRILVNDLVCTKYMNFDENKEYEREFAVGETIRVKLPQRYVVRTGLGYNPQALDRVYTTVTVNQIFGVDFEWDSVENALKMERGQDAISREYLKPAMSQIANKIDEMAAQFAYLNTNNIVGALGINPTSMTTYEQARQRLVEKACPKDDEKGMIIPPSFNTSLVPNLASYLNPSKEIDDQYIDGMMGRMSGFKWWESVNLYNHTAGTWAGAVTVFGSGQSGSAIAISATAGDTFNKGDVISFDAVYAVNPVSRRVVDSINLMQFVVTQDLTAAGSNADTLNISPAIAGPGSHYQNVDALPLTGAALTLFPGTSAPNGKHGMNGLAIQRNAFAMVGVNMEVPKAVEMSSQKRDPKTGIAVRFIRMFDPVQSKMINRFDVLLGFGSLYPDSCAVRILGS